MAAHRFDRRGVLREKRTAYISDLTRQPELAQPFGAGGDFKSVLATPVSLAGTDRGLLVACSSGPSHWTEEQFRVIEWVAGQCGLIMETLHNQKALAEHARALEAAHRSKDTFLAMLSHELRTPLTPILISSGMLAQDTRLPPDVLKLCQMILRNVAIAAGFADHLTKPIESHRLRTSISRVLSKTASCDAPAPHNRPLAWDGGGATRPHEDGSVDRRGG